LMRCCEVREHGEVLTAAELVAQTLCFFRPHPSKAWPKRFDEIHLMTVLDDTAAQVVQVFGFCSRPPIWHQLPCAAVGRSESISYGIEVDCLERPTLKRKRRVVEVARNPVPQT